MLLSNIAYVRLLSSGKKTDRPFDYLIPAGAAVTKGALVAVPFGKGNRKQFGIVVSVCEKEPEMTLKTVLSVYPEEFSLSDEMLSLCEYMVKHVFCTFGEAAKCMIPSHVYKSAEKTEKVYFLTRDADSERFISGFRGAKKEKYKAILDLLLAAGKSSSKVLSDAVGATGAELRFLSEKGLISFSEVQIERNPYSFIAEKEKEDIILSEAQNRAFSELSAMSDSGEPVCALLHGITGSGKTSVMLKLCDKVISENRKVIFLVPEIALTSQSSRLLIARYGKRVAVIHSALSDGEKRDAFAAIRNGEKDIVLGTRSAVFAPMKNIGLIIIDEEQDQSYKSDSAAKYRAKDIASFRCLENRAMLLLSSATPDIETYSKAKNGSYKLVELNERYGTAILPEVVISDLRSDLRRSPGILLGEKMRAELRSNLVKKEQSILLMNRRGYKNFVSCLDCGEVIKCPNCSVSLTVHNGKKKTLTCHWCGYTAELPAKCPECSSEHLIMHGAGIQQLEEEINTVFPEARVLRLDSDTADGKMAHDRIIEDFRNEKADILIGTQMVAKGHNFPKVTLVGIVMADTALYLSDYRAAEHTFSLLTQVIGRAGRAELRGRAVIQTLNPRHNVFSLAAKQDYRRFYEDEIIFRKNFVFPPFCSIAVFTLSCTDEKKLFKDTASFSETLSGLLTKDFGDVKFIVYGPFEATVYKVKNIFRKRYIIKFKNNKRSRELLSLILDRTEDYASKITLDVNPSMI